MNLLDPVETLKGIGPKTAQILNKAGIKTAKDFFYNLPRTYENYQSVTKIADLRPGNVIVKGKIDSLSSHRTRRKNFTITEGVIRDQSGVVRVVWFNQAYRAKQFKPDQEYLFAGLYDLKNGRFQLTSPSVSPASDFLNQSSIKPVYVAHGTLKSDGFWRLIQSAKPKFAEIPDLLPFTPKNTRQNSLFDAHFPFSDSQIDAARQYLAYEELFEFILAAKLNQLENQKLQAQPIPFQLDLLKQLLATLPFQLTNAQRRACWEIFQDLEQPTPMNRLLQGDVGSGKTMVAALSAFMAAKNHTQTALLAPTAILATQHFASLKKLLEPLHITVALLTGATKPREKQSLKTAVKQGKIDLIIGTHALLTDDTEFSNLGLVIIDEQHRFGVEQRQKLLLKSPKNLAPHLLAMTATPIPRSLQLTIFGDLDVSILDELPKGRQPIKTKIIPEIAQSAELYPKIHETLAAKQQIYWICKAIDDNPKSETTSVKSRAAKLQKLLPHAKIAFLHGRMKPAEKDEIMQNFAAHKIQILVSTTVVEVGVDVPNATLIIIENAENYGLAQLHQLRGRVGRGTKPSQCFLLTAGENQPSRRLRELENSTDGFYLAEVDLKLRGPGEIYGALQHGALNLRIANLSDTKLIAKARKDVAAFLQNPQNMLEYKELMDNISHYQQLTTLN